jgi:hypothetical protein
LPGGKTDPSRLFFQREDFRRHNKIVRETFILLHNIDNVDKDTGASNPNNPSGEFIFAAKNSAHLLISRQRHMTESRTFTKALLPIFILLGFGFQPLMAQEWGTDLRSPGVADSTATDSTAPAVGGWGEPEGTPDVQVKPRVPYKRFVPPYDSLREIIYYSGVIEDENCETCGADSLYWRTINFLTRKFGKEKMKDKTWVLENVVGNKIVMKITVPMMVQTNAYNKRQSGMIEYRMAIRFQESRFKYQFGNFVHVEVERGAEARMIRTYHEYYMRVKKGYQNTDIYLLAADRDVKEFVEGLKRALRGPYQPDEEDW